MKAPSLNHAYRLIWSQVHNAWIAVAEIASSRGKSRSVKRLLNRSVAAGTALLFASSIHADQTGGQVVSGAGSINQSGNTTTINQSSQHLGLTWDTFNINTNQTVNFIQPNKAALAVNRIFDTNASKIMGNLNANGQVWLINPNGVFFGPSAQVNVGSILASTLNPLSDSGDAEQVFGNGGTGSVINLGTINAADGGYVALLGNTVSNQGTITANLGTVALGAGSKVRLQFAGSELLGLSVDESTLNNLAENKQLIKADGGAVFMSAGAKDSVLASVVNNEGVIEAQTVQNQDGKIILMGGMEAGTTKVAGTLDASAINSSENGDGGFIETSAANVQIDDDVKVTTLAKNGETGTWLIDPTDFNIEAGSAAKTNSGIGANTLNTSLGSSDVHIATVATGSENGDINVNAAVTWNAATELKLTAHGDININQAITAQDANGKLALEYGQGAVASGNTATYNVNAKVNLQAGDNFSTKLGSDGTTTQYKVITDLGAAGSSTGTDLQGINGNLTGNYVLGADIDASATNGWNSGAGFNPIGDNSTNTNATRFTGIFDGLGHSIANLNIDRASTNYVGLFGFTNHATIQNIGLNGGAVKGQTNVGSLVGYHANSTIKNSYANVQVTGSTYTGGLVGYHTGGNISTSYASGSVIGQSLTGGLIGSVDSGTVNNSYASGSVTGDTTTGGLAGESVAGTISNSYASGAITGNSSTGGLIGNNNGTITNSFWNRNTTGIVSGVGAGSASGATGKTTAEMRQLNTFASAGWDIDSQGGTDKVWRIYDGYTQPYLRTFLTPLNLVPDYDGVNVGTVTGSRIIWMPATTPDNPLLNTNLIQGGTANPNTQGVLTFSSTEAGSYQVTTDISHIWTNSQLGYDLMSRRVIATPGSAKGDIVLANGLNWRSGTVNIDTSGTVSASNAITSSSGIFHLQNGNWQQKGSNLPSFSVRDFRISGGTFLRATGGEGTLASPYQLTDIYGVQGISTHLDKHFSLANDIDASAAAFWYSDGKPITPSYAGFKPIGTQTNPFTGQFDGSGYTINNLTISRPSENDVGLFGVTNNAVLSNTVFTNMDIEGQQRVGGLVGYSKNSQIRNNTVAGSVKANLYDGGGLIGQSQSSEVNSNHSSAQVSATGAVGGLVGRSTDNSSITNNTTTSSVKGNSSVGGLVGHNIESSVHNNYAKGTVEAIADAYGNPGGDAGGLVGYNERGVISNSYAASTVNAPFTSGGLVGNNEDGSINNSYAIGTVTGTQSIGGLVGWNRGTGKVENSYAMGNVTGTTDVGGLIGVNDGTVTNSYYTDTTGQDDAGKGEKKSIKQLAAVLPTGFDAAVWGNGSNQTTPYLLSHGVFDTAGPTYLGTDATAANAYQAIINVNQLQAINNNLSGKYVLGNNIDASGTSTWNSDGAATPTYAGFNPLGNTSTKFTGTFDGLGHTVDKLTINRPTENHVGLFAGVVGATIRNIGLTDVNIVGQNFVGALATRAGNSSTISNAYVTGTISGAEYVGGLIGYTTETGRLEDVYSTATVSGIYNVGGLAGSVSGAVDGGARAGWTKNAYATGNVSGTHNVGGLFGKARGDISNVYATGNVTGSTTGVGTTSTSFPSFSPTISATNVGGLIGQLDDTYYTTSINKVYATGNVTGTATTNNVGGLIGQIDNASPKRPAIDNTYATGQVTGNDNVGGLIGEAKDSDIKTSYATGAVTGGTGVGGLVGVSDDSTVSNSYYADTTGQSDTGKGEKKTIAELAAALPTGFSNSVWGNGSNQTTPYLLSHSVFDTAGPTYLGTDTNATTPYQAIINLDQLQAIKNDLTGNYVLGNNIDASATSTWNGGAGFDPLGSGNGNNIANTYRGIFNGLGHSISNLTINRPTKSRQSLFGSITTDTTIRNVHLSNASVSGFLYVGGLVSNFLDGSHGNGVIESSSVSGNVSGGAFVGGLVGRAYQIADSSSSATVTGSDGVGGLAGSSQKKISNSSATGNVTSRGGDAGGLVGFNYGDISDSHSSTGTVKGKISVGGLVGQLNGGSITNSYSSSTIDATKDGKNSYAGGLVGLAKASSTISNSYATGSVTATGNNVGGLIGVLAGSSISNSYATGTTQGLDVTGGLVGNSDNSTISNSYANSSVTGGVVVGGLVGQQYASSVSNSYATGATQGDSSTGGLVGLQDLNSSVSNSYYTDTTGQVAGEGERKTIAELASALPTGFSNSVWGNGSNQTTPYLLSHGIFDTAGPTYLGTDTNATTPYQAIININQLQAINNNLSGNYVLGNNIDASATSTWNSNAGFNPLGNASTGFTGTFDGLGHTVNDLTINRPSTNYVGLFGVTDGATIQNVGMVGGSVTGNKNVGGLVGINNSNSSVSNSYATGAVTGNSQVGGLVGNNDDSSVSNSYATGAVKGSSANVGGLVGVVFFGNVSNSYATGAVTGNIAVGGLVGDNNSSSVSNSYATGAVTGNVIVGGLVGFNNSGRVSNSFWNTETSNQPTVGIGFGSSAGVSGKTTAEMQTLSTFTSAGWDIDDEGGTGKIWRIYEGNTSPLLRSFMTQLDLTGNNKTTTYDGTTQSIAYTLPTGTDASLVLGSTSGKNAGTYNGLYSSQQGYDIKGGGLTIAQKTFNIEGSRVYDATNVFNTGDLQLTGLIGSEQLTVNAIVPVTVTDKNVGTNKTPTGGTISWGDGTGGLASNYTFGGMSFAITPKAITVAAVADNKTYDATTTATLSSLNSVGVIAGDSVNFSNIAANFVDANAGVGKTVNVTGISATGTDVGNYSFNNTATTLANIDKATLTYVASPNTMTAGQTPNLTGDVTGFVGADNLANATTGALLWTTAGNTTQPGTYDITGSGLNAVNYLFVQDPANTSALTVQAGSVPNAISTTTNSFLPTGTPSPQQNQVNTVDVNNPNTASGGENGDGGLINDPQSQSQVIDIVYTSCDPGQDGCEETTTP